MLGFVLKTANTNAKEHPAMKKRSQPMSQSFRQPEIFQIAQADGKVLVDDLAARFGVTVQTIRRDLSGLVDAGRLQRVHGGAILPSGTTNIGYEDRRALNKTAKAAIARACAGQLPDGASIFLNIGTSTEAVARELAHRGKMLVVTNNINVATILAANPDAQVIVTGGTLRRSDGGLVGSLASNTIRQFRFDYAVVGCSALDENGDMLDFDVQEVEVSQTILAQSRRSFLVADQSKFGRSAPARINSLAQIDRFFTDQPLAPALMQRCADWGTEIVITGQGPMVSNRH